MSHGPVRTATVGGSFFPVDMSASGPGNIPGTCVQQGRCDMAETPIREDGDRGTSHHGAHIFSLFFGPGLARALDSLGSPFKPATVAVLLVPFFFLGPSVGGPIDD